MKEQITHDQHYVWRAYLRPWCEIKGKKNKQKSFIWWSKSSLIKNTDIFDILKDDDFYEFKKLNDLEVFIIKTFFAYTKWDAVKTVNKLLDDSIEIAGMIKNEEIDLNIKGKLINLGEKVNTVVEKIGYDFLEKIKKDDLSFFDLNNNEDAIDFVLFLCFQYFRTKNMKLNWVESFSGDLEKIKDLYTKTTNKIAPNNVDFNAVYNYGYIYLVHSVLYGILYFGAHMELLKTSGKRFIVSDQPIFNIAKNQKDDFDLFYPITPDRAIIISKKFSKNIVLNINDKEVESYNRKIKENSREFIMSKEKGDIDDLVNT